MEAIEDAIYVILIFILPIWLFLHYRLKTAQAKNGLSKEEREQVAQLTEQAERLQRRVESLEIILDESLPDWRARQ
ncbi:envelope stress response membrane protein PspB [Ectothiorhodospiraceae bacterium BW-2]|nr:envelope stress response membrane protein PspB [Ectothiorhodospiraceae bacterium BW-2]